MTDQCDEWDWWWGAWQNSVRCGVCHALMDVDAPCPVCAADYSEPEPLIVDGEIVSYQRIVPGALDWSPYVMLQIMHRDWLRPLPATDPNDLPHEREPSARVLVVLVFWTYFETLMDWYYEAAMDRFPNAVARDLLGRYGMIGRRLNQLHQILFGKTYAQDLAELGFGEVARHLEHLQKQRNAFVHGNPEAIDDPLVEQTVRLIPCFHEAWISSFNHRCAWQR